MSAVTMTITARDPAHARAILGGQAGGDTVAFWRLLTAATDAAPADTPQIQPLFNNCPN